MKEIYAFEEGDGQNRKLLGGKGAGLCEMTRLKLPVPPGFTITTQVCDAYYQNGKSLPGGLMTKVSKHIAKVAKKTGKAWGSPDNPLLVSVRSGAAISMPGMMDTILNLGLNDETVRGLAAKSSNPRFAWDSYRRFVQLFGKVVFGIDDRLFDNEMNAKKKERGAENDSDLDAAALEEITASFKKICADSGHTFPTDPTAQLELAITAVFDSWMGERAIVYRAKNKITKDIAAGTAVNVVAMVFGNMGSDSATGVVFTRNPGDGSRQIYGDYLQDAQGEDVVAGVRTGKHVSEMKSEMPESYKQLEKTCDMLEKHFREPQDIEFTVEQGRFYLLQTRNAKMNAASMVRTSIDMVNEKMISRDRAITRLNAEQLEQLLHDMPDQSEIPKYEKLATGIAASPGAASGAAIFDVKKAAAMGKDGHAVILVREETKPEDVPAFFESLGILTSRGGKSSHAAVVARGMGKPCIVGCADLKITETGCTTSGGARISEGDIITIDGSTGSVYAGSIPTIKPEITPEFRRILDWAAKAKRLGVRANADTPAAAALARKYGAQGIGLCRTERMFNQSDRLVLFVKMIMAADKAQREKLLKRLGRLQKSDFVKILTAMEGYPVTIRLLDPPLHEFLPNPEAQAAKVKSMEGSGRSKASKSDLEEARTVLERARELAEINPMMGHRGVRVGVTYPEIYRMQIRAVFEALAALAKKGVKAKPQIMIPQISSVEELDHIKQIYDEVKREVEEENGRRKLNVNFGTMIEVVRAALTADQLARTAEFFSFGTNDLTQGTFSFSREDVEGKFMPEYMDKGLLEQNPFQSIDRSGVGRLMSQGIRMGRGSRKGMEIGICGEHGGDPSSVVFCHNESLSYVSASPHRIPIAIVAAAQAAVIQKENSKGKKRSKRKK